MTSKVLFLLGPTGVGKSSLAISLAKKMNFEIISADSVQVYKDFDIGSAKVTEEEMDGVKHYGIDIVSPDQEFSASEFVNYTKQKIEEILTKGKTPLVVGGTALYVKSLVEGFNFGEIEKNADFRKQMECLADEQGLNALYERLKAKAPDVAEKIDKNNKVRLIRALEIAEFGGQITNSKPSYDFFVFALTMPREKIYQNINKRVEVMIESGLIEETQRLYEKYGDCRALGAIGYKETLSYLKNEITKEQMVNLISQHTRNYAKRQLTFLRSLPYVKYFDKTEEDYQIKIEKEIGKWLTK